MSQPKPGSEHQVFHKDVGEWDADVEINTGSSPTKSKGRMTSRLTCGGMWLVSDYSSEGGFSGHGMWTWDPQKKKYVGVWADNQMTIVAPGEGTWDPSRRMMTFVYEGTINGNLMRWKQTTETVDGNTLLFKSFVPADAPKESMKVTYRRRATLPSARWS